MNKKLVLSLVLLSGLAGICSSNAGNYPELAPAIALIKQHFSLKKNIPTWHAVSIKLLAAIPNTPEFSGLRNVFEKTKDYKAGWTWANHEAIGKMLLEYKHFFPQDMIDQFSKRSQADLVRYIKLAA